MNNTPAPTDAEQEILTYALEAFAQETGLQITIVARKPRQKDRIGPKRVARPDVILELEGREYTAEIKPWAQHAPVGAVIDMVKRHQTGILVADYVNPTMANRLREQNVFFIDAAGNAFIDTHNCHIVIKGNRNPKALDQQAKPHKRRAFTAAGLKVTYALLCHPQLANKPYRDIAEAAGVALGTVGKVIEDLMQTGFLIERDTGERRLIRREHLLQTWVERYPAMLRHKLHMGYFQAPRADWWQDFPIHDVDGLWGGEIAAAHYTRYLKPAVATVYLPKAELRKLIAEARLRKLALPTYETGMVETLTPFWALAPTEDVYVHPIIAYADLVATQDPRNAEVARKLYDDRIARHLE